MRYYAVRYKSTPEQCRIERAGGASFAFKRAFGGHPSDNAEWKDLGTNSKIVCEHARRIALIKAPEGWNTFPADHAQRTFMRLRLYQLEGPASTRLEARTLVCVTDTPIARDIDLRAQYSVFSIEPHDSTPATTLGELFQRPTPREMGFFILAVEKGTLVLVSDKDEPGPSIRIRPAHAQRPAAPHENGTTHE